MKNTQVYVVWPHTGTRLSSKAYCLCLLMMLGYFVVVVLMMIGEIVLYFFSDKLITLGFFCFGRTKRVLRCGSRMYHWPQTICVSVSL